MDHSQRRILDRHTTVYESPCESLYLRFLIFSAFTRVVNKKVQLQCTAAITTFTVPGAGPSYRSLGHVTRDSTRIMPQQIQSLSRFSGFPRVLRVHDGPCGTPCSVSCSVHGPPCPGHFECHTSRFDPEILGLCHSVRIDVGRRVRSHSSRAATFAVHVQS